MGSSSRQHLVKDCGLERENRWAGRHFFQDPKKVVADSFQSLGPAPQCSGIGIAWRVARIATLSPRLIDCSRQPKISSTSSSARAEGNLSLSAMMVMRSDLVMDATICAK